MAQIPFRNVGAIMNDNKNSFLDPKTLSAVVLVAALWFGWQSYLTKKYPQSSAGKTATMTAEKAGELANNPTGSLAADEAATAKDVVGKKSVSSNQGEEKKININSPTASFELSSSGMGLKNVKLLQYTKRDSSAIEFAKALDQGLFELHLLGNPQAVDFQIELRGENTFVGTAQIGKMKIIREIVYSPETFSFKNTISVYNPEPSFGGLSIVVTDRREAKTSSGSFLAGNSEHQEFLVSHDSNKVDTTNITSAKESIDKTQTQVSILSLASQYFAAAAIDHSEIAPEAHIMATVGATSFQGLLSYKTSSLKDRMDFSFISYVGPKSHEILEKADPELGRIIDLGWYGSIGRILLVILKWFNGYIGNWGFSIIALTLLVRALVAPFSVSSYKSMNKMKKIQPLLQAAKARYKDDPTAQQRETMAIMKQEKVNPLGGCLPMLLQMPIFFALFRTLGQSIDLYQAPFIWWIHDLSLKDPYYVLPILMGVTMYIQQKITPSTMDPQQAKIMQFMPIMFSFFMISLPSGLTLYTFVSTLFGILQQRFFMRDRQAVLAAKEAKA